MPLRVLLVDDNPDDRTLAARALQREFPDLETYEVTDRETFEPQLARGGFDAVVTDFHIGWTDGLAILRAVKGRFPARPVVMFTNTGSEEIAVEAMKEGLDDYVIKAGKHYLRLPAALRAALERAEARQQAARLEVRLESLLNRVNVGVFRATAEGRLLESNPALLRLLGVAGADDAAAASASFHAHLWLPFEADERHNPTQKVGAGGPALRDREAQITRPDGSTVWVSVNEAAARLNDEAVIEGIVEDITLRKQAEDLALWQRDFLRDVLFSVTGGRLRLCDTPACLPARLPAVTGPVTLTQESLRPVRMAVHDAALEYGFPAGRGFDLMSAVHEAAMNAVKHGRGGVAYVGATPDGGTVQAWIEDQGTGIGLDYLHRATLEAGYTTAGSFGHGWGIVLRFSDRVFLQTGTGGTTVVIEMDRTPPPPAFLG